LTPVYCVLLTGAMCFVGLNLSLETATGFINFGAFLGFTAVNLIPGSYTVAASRTGFRPVTFRNFVLQVGQTARLDITMEVGTVEQTVEVTGTLPLLQTENASVGQVIEQGAVNALPLNGRNFLDLARLQPGAETVDGGSFDPTKANYTGVSIGGQAGRSTQITVDGGSVVDNIVGTTVQNFSQEIVQEFQVGISNMDLSTGASASGSVNIVSKGGTNQYHGNGYLYWRDARFAAFPALDRLDAVHGLPPELRVSRIPFDREQFGGTFGGPIKKDKMFFFANVEYNNQDDISIHNQTPGSGRAIAAGGDSCRRWAGNNRGDHCELARSLPRGNREGNWNLRCAVVAL